MNGTPDISLRLAGPPDAETIHEMIVALAQATNSASKVSSTASDFSRFGFGDKAFFEALIAEADGRPIGLCVYFYTFSTWLGEPGIYVQDLYVNEDLRGAGVGRRLLQETARRGRKRHASHLRLTVDHDNTSASHFYAHIGMHHRTEEDTYHIGGQAFLEWANG
jgi:GNAT superfamily N-acetyltransferase